MNYTYAKVIADSVDTWGQRLTTLELFFPRIILAELSKHRMFSFNTASSRAIPITRNMDEIDEFFYESDDIRINQKGMQGFKQLVDSQLTNYHVLHRRLWNFTKDIVAEMVTTDAHKQHVNRYMEPFQYTRVILTATEFNNFFLQRNHPSAMPDIQLLAKKMHIAIGNSVPTFLRKGEWHLPYQLNDEYNLPIADQIAICVARCARVSYNNFETNKPDVEKDLKLFNFLIDQTPPHLSPLEHVAQCTDFHADEFLTESGEYVRQNWFANFRGWQSYRWQRERKLDGIKTNFDNQISSMKWET